MLHICGINKKHGSQFFTDYTGSPKDEGQDISRSILYDCNATHTCLHDIIFNEFNLIV